MPILDGKSEDNDGALLAGQPCAPSRTLWKVFASASPELPEQAVSGDTVTDGGF